MNKERFLAANTIALITHTLVFSFFFNNLDPTSGPSEGEIPDASRRQDVYWSWLVKRMVPLSNHGRNS